MPLSISLHFTSLSELGRSCSRKRFFYCGKRFCHSIVRVVYRVIRELGGEETFTGNRHRRSRDDRSPSTFHGTERTRQSRLIVIQTAQATGDCPWPHGKATLRKRNALMPERGDIIVGSLLPVSLNSLSHCRGSII